MKSFQTIVLIIFILLIVLAVFIFATSGNSNTSDANINMVVWGTLDGIVMNDFFRAQKILNNDFPNVDYVEKDPVLYEDEIINATARGQSPDLFLVTNENLLDLQDLIFPIPFSSYSERSFKDNFIEGAEIFIKSGNIYAFPLAVDPMVMYWNRSLFQSYGLSQPPKYWDEFLTIAPRITEKDDALNIKKSAVSLGEYDNINHAKEIISSIMFMSDNSIVAGVQTGELRSVFAEREGQASPSESALRFYTDFANPTKTTYSWNRSLPEAKEYFLSGNLAVYFGFSGELEEIRNKNPNLNFDVALMPQIRDFNNRAVFGNIYGLAVAKTSKNISPALRLLGSVTSQSSAIEINEGLFLPPVRRDLLAQKQDSAANDIFWNSAIISKSFLVPDKVATEDLFEEMIESIISGRSRLGEAISRFDTSLNKLLVDKK